MESMPEMPKPLLSETLSMPLLQYESSEEVEIGSGDEERLLPTDLLNDDDEEIKPTLRKTWSWTPEAKDEEVQKILPHYVLIMPIYDEKKYYNNSFPIFFLSFLKVIRI